MYTATWALLTDGRQQTIIVSDDGELHPESNAFFMSLVLMGRSPNTAATYGRGIAKFLTWCQDEGVDWHSITLLNLARFRRKFEATNTTHHKPPSPSLVALTFAGVSGFLRYCAAERLIGSWVAEQLVEPKLTGGVLDRDDPRGLRQARRLHVDVPEQPLPHVPADIIDLLLNARLKPRDHFLTGLLWCTAMRIGEALTLWQEDLHTLPSSTHIGCGIAGAHVHIARHNDQMYQGGARAKSGPRILPLDDDTVARWNLYLDWRSERRLDGRHAFVVSQGDTRNQPVKYGTVLAAFETTITRRLNGFDLRPHMVRHARATYWVRNGVDLDIVRALLGHASILTTQRYLHAGIEDMRAAVAAAQ